MGALTRIRPGGAAFLLIAALLAHLAAVQRAEASSPDSGSAAPRARVEARSSDLLAVGTVHGEHMAIHLTRIVDNSPVSNAVVAVLLRGTSHPAVAEADGSYSFQTSELALPGPAAIEFLVTLGDAHQELHGTLELAGEPGHSEDKSSSRQLGWWVLNFAVCIGFLYLWSRRKSADA